MGDMNLTGVRTIGQTSGRAQDLGHPPAVLSPPWSLAGVFRLSGNALVYILSNGLQRGATVLVMPLLLTRLTVADYGRYGLLLSIYVLATPFLSLGLYGAISRFYFDTTDAARRRWIISTLLQSQAISILLGIVILDLVVGRFVNKVGGVEYHPYVRLALWAAAATALQEGVMAFWRAAERPLWVALAQLLSFVATIGAITFFLFQQDMGLRGVLLGLLVGQAVVSIVVFLLAIFETQIAWDPRILIRALAFSLPLVPHLIVGWLLRASDRWILQHYRGPEELGTYFFSYQLASVISLVMFSSNDAIAPRFLASYRDRGAEGARTFQRQIFPFYCWGAVGLASTLILLGPSLVPILSRGRVAHVPVLISILAGAIVASALYSPFANALFAVKKTARLTMLTVTCGVLNVGLNLLLVPQLGALGAAVAMLISYSVLVITILEVAHRQLGIDREFMHLSIAAAALALVTWIVSR